MLSTYIESCRVALFTKGQYGPPSVERAVFSTTWSSIFEQASLLRNCLLSSPPEGGHRPFMCKSAT